MHRARVAFLLVISISVLVPPRSHADLGAGMSQGSLTIPSSRLSDWTQAGIPGGIPDTSNTTLWPVIDTDTTNVGSCTHFTPAEKADATDDHLKIQCYVNYAATQAGVGGRIGTVVKLGAGTFRLGITPQYDSYVLMKSNVVLKGSGQTQTLISGTQGGPHWQDTPCVSGGWGFILFNGSCVGNPAAPLAVTTTPIPVGTTQLTLSDASSLAVGDWITFSQKDDSAYIDTNDGEGPYMNHIAKVTNKTSNTITIDRPLRHAFNPAKSPVILEITPLQNAGIESFKIMNDENTEDRYIETVNYNYSANCWAKDVHFYNGLHMHIQIKESRGTHIESNLFERLLFGVYGGGAAPWDNYGVNIAHRAQDSLVVNNIFKAMYIPTTIVRGAHGNVFAYNYIVASNGGSMGIFFHGNYPHDNLIEGNDTDGIISVDNWWGRQGPGNTFYRNRLRNDGLGSYPPAGPWPNGWMRNEHSSGTYTITATYLSAINNSAYAWSEAPYTQYPGGGDYLTDITNSWLEKNTYRDPTAASTRGFINNNSHATDTVTDMVKSSTPPSAWVTFSFPASFYTATKPSWWCNETPWPAIGANVDNFGGALEKLPAQRRYEGLLCTASGGGAQALGVPGRPALVP